MKPCEQCDRPRLQLLLNEALPETIERDVADHVATCATCQQELESLAATQGWWEEASQRLSKSSAEVASLRLAGIGRTSINANKPQSDLGSNASNFSADAFDEAYASDFAVDFLEPSDDAAVLGRLGDYEIIDVIGRGGMGIVLKGFQKELHRFVAVKVLAPHLATSGAARRRFAREAQATAAVVNPHVMAIHSVHANTKLPYLVMPFIECESLQQRLDHGGPLDLKDVLRIGMQAALGLAAAHAQGIVHRDVKPANILLEANVDRVMLTDFGLARAVDDASLTRTGIIAGTPQYMSPEQANGDAIDHRSDLFSLGSVLYAMCTARPPFRAETTFGVLRRIREIDPRSIREVNPDIPDWFERLVLTLLSKTPEQRIASACEVAALLEQCLAHVQQPTMVNLPRDVECPPAQSKSPKDLPTIKAKRAIRWAICATSAVASIALWVISPRIFFSSNERVNSATSGSVVESDADAKTLDPLFEWNQTQNQLNATDQWLEQIEVNFRTESDEQP